MAELEVGILGAGYVGLSSAVCLAHLGHRVTCVDIDSAKVEDLRGGLVPISEPALEPLLRDGLDAGRLGFGSRLEELSHVGVVILCLPTPMGRSGAPDLAAIDSVLPGLREVLAPDAVLVTKSTVPVGTSRRIERDVGRSDVRVVNNPEFLREGHAVHDFLHPDRLVIGADDPAAGKRVAALYEQLAVTPLYVDTVSAELSKYVSNAFLAIKASWANAVSDLCDRVGADVLDVTRVMGADNRIGPAYLAAGPGWGGSCLPKDTRALLSTAEQVGMELPVLAEAVAANAQRVASVVDTVRVAVTGARDGSLRDVRLGVLGLTFKAGTDDLRESPAVAVAERLAAEGAVVTGYDPELTRSRPPQICGITVVDDPSLVAKDAAGIVLLTEWPQFRQLDWVELGRSAEQRVVVDCRNLLDGSVLHDSGFRHTRLGCPERTY